MELSASAMFNCTVSGNLQGITVIGHEVVVENNVIEVLHKHWVSANQSFGVTMGVSAGFVGSRSVFVVGNVIKGADYSVGADGSYPLYMSTVVLKHDCSALPTVRH